MSDTYGAGLNFATIGPGASAPPSAPLDISPQIGPGASAPPAAPLDISPQIDNSGALPAGGIQTRPAPVSPAPAPTSAPQPTFGSSLSLLGPNYNAPNPAETALDQSAGVLQNRITQAGKVATNWLAQIFAPEQVQAARDAMPKMTEQLQQILTQKAQIQAGRAQAQQLDLTPDEAPDQATQDDRIQIASVKAINGDLRAFLGISAIAPDRAAAIAPQVYAKIGSHLNNAQMAFDSLSGMENEGHYQAKIQQLRTDGTITDLEGAGLELPPTLDAFKAAAPWEELALRNARAAINAQGQALEQRNTYTPMATDEQNTYKGALKTVYGDELNLGPWSRNGATGTRGQLANGIATVDQYGITGSAATADQREQIGKDFQAAVPPTDIEKLRGFNRTYSLAITDDKGNPLPANQINTNPNVSQAVSESLASLLRGGRGSATAGLLNIEASKRGAVQSMFDKIQGAYAGTINTLTGDEVRPYLTKLTQEQQRAVLDGLNNYTESNVSDRALGVARRAGALGLGVDALGLGKEEAGSAVNNAVEQGRLAQIERMRPYFQPIGAGNGVLQLGAQRPGANPVSLPPGAQPTNQLPNAQPLLTPVQQAGQGAGASVPSVRPAPPNPSPPSSPGGAGQQPSPTPQPVTIAGQQVAMALPPGASPAYVASLQRIETGNVQNPWTASAKGTSAGGAYQFVKATWDANKPPGAPATAAAATPEQQTAALEKLTNGNAASLQTAGIPVNDTNLYVAHNLGAAGAASLLKADPNADARTVVGEAAARNNPTFFKGRPTVATVLGRYQANVAQDISNTVPRGPADTSYSTPAQREALARRGVDTSAPGPTPEQRAGQWAQTREGLAGIAPAALGTVGAIAGGAVAGAPGAVAGGAVGGGAGQALKDYVQGNKQSPAKIAEQTALGGVLGVASEARPVLAAAGRVVGTAGIEAGNTAVQGGNAADVVDAGLRGGAEALGGEALGRFVSMGGAAAYKALSRYTTDAQSELSAQAGKLAAARDVLKTEQPKLADGTTANPKYEAAQQRADDATDAIKDHGQDPDDMVHAYQQATAGVPSGEAVVMRRAQSAANETSQGYNQLRQDVQNTGVGVPKAQQSLPDGPVAQVRTADNPRAPVDEKFMPDAVNAQRLATAPAANWGQKWGDLQQAGHELIEKRLAFIANNDKPSADAMDGIFQGIRNQQKAAANYVFGPTKGPQVISRLEGLDKSWATIMTGSGGLNYGKMQQVLQGDNTPQRRAMETAFKSFASGDPSAMRAFNAMKAGAAADWKMMIPVVAGEAATNLAGIPTLGTVSAAAAAGLGGQRLYRVMRQYMNAKVLGQPVQFKDFFLKDLQQNPLSHAVRGAVQRGAVQGDVLNNPGNTVRAALPYLP